MKTNHNTTEQEKTAISAINKIYGPYTVSTLQKRIFKNDAMTRLILAYYVYPTETSYFDGTMKLVSVLIDTEKNTAETKETEWLKLEDLTEEFFYADSEMTKEELIELQTANAKQAVKEEFKLTEKDLSVIWHMIVNHSFLHYDELESLGFSAYTLRKLQKNGLIENERENELYCLTTKTDIKICQIIPESLYLEIES